MEVNADRVFRQRQRGSAATTVLYRSRDAVAQVSRNGDCFDQRVTDLTGHLHGVRLIRTVHVLRPGR